MKTSLKLAAVALSAFGIAGGAALAQAQGMSSGQPTVTPQASPMPGFSTNGTPRGNGANSAQSSDSSSNMATPDNSSSTSSSTGNSNDSSSTTSMGQPRADRN